MPHISKIVITGGPCGGKSTALGKIEQHFAALGYYVMFINETATEMMKNGSFPWVGTVANFQTSLLMLQQSKEEIYFDWASRLNMEKILLVCDRGAMDGKAYMPKEEFYAMLSSLQLDENELRNNYGAVFHLVTAANGAEDFYQTTNNQTRTEGLEQAKELDDMLIAAWEGHPHFRIIDNSTGFEEKIERLIGEIEGFLGEPEPFEIERKFLIECPDTAMLESLPNCQKVDIIQTYLISPDPDSELRIRQRGYEGNYIYVKTEKRKISDIKRVEVERRLSKSEYLSLLMNADTALRQIRKTRYCLTHDRQYFEIDIYPFWDKQAILEIELTQESDKITFPDFIRVIREVTDDETYKNKSLAYDIPAEMGAK
ncbi:MAG: AAA family ATPase [Oscillospiraceae bacterium]|nr:AAA family ATPase [Oscillospiraceae bacterium]